MRKVCILDTDIGRDIDDSWALAQIIGMTAVRPVSLQSLEHWGRTEKGGFSKAQEALVAQERITEEVGG